MVCVYIFAVVPTESQNPTTTSPRQVQTEAAATTNTTAATGMCITLYIIVLSKSALAHTRFCTMPIYMALTRTL